MSISVNYIDSESSLLLEFVRSLGGERRLWIRDPNSNYASIGWCPHKNLGYGECNDCALVLEDE